MKDDHSAQPPNCQLNRCERWVQSYILSDELSVQRYLATKLILGTVGFECLDLLGHLAKSKYVDLDKILDSRYVNIESLFRA